MKNKRRIKSEDDCRGGHLAAEPEKIFELSFKIK